jgi:cation diffusion facilitator family transporter
MTASRTLAIALTSVAVGLLVLVLKYVAYTMTGSVALLSDALESIVNVVTAITTLIAVFLASKPANATLPYGYDKAEYFSAVIEGVFILVAALLIFQQAYLRFVEAAPLDASMEGLFVNGAAGVINGAWCLVLFRHGRKTRSPALVADAKHLLTDVVSSAGVLVGVFVAIVSGISILDPILAALVAVNILWSGYKLVSESVGGLMDVAVPEEQLTRIREVIAVNAEGAIEAHDVRTRQSGRKTFVEFHLVVPGHMSVSEAHDICDRIENALSKAIEGAMISIHVEPENKAKHAGIVVL